jgi:hypothetical protein
MGGSKFLKANCRGGLSAQQQRRRYDCRVFRVEVARLEALLSLGPWSTTIHLQGWTSIWLCVDTSRVRVADRLLQSAAAVLKHI